MSLKGKNKGLLERAEEAIDESVELKDTVEDVAAVFEGISATFETNIDEAELLEELDEMVGASTEASEPKAAASIPITAYPNAPRGAVKQEKIALLAAEQ